VQFCVFAHCFAPVALHKEVPASEARPRGTRCTRVSDASNAGVLHCSAHRLTPGCKRRVFLAAFMMRFPKPCDSLSRPHPEGMHSLRSFKYRDSAGIDTTTHPCVQSWWCDRYSPRCLRGCARLSRAQPFHHLPSLRHRTRYSAQSSSSKSDSSSSSSSSDAISIWYRRIPPMPPKPFTN
jgi:hypothetical protein